MVQEPSLSTSSFLFQVDSACTKIRLDRYLADRCPHFSRSFIQTQIRQGSVKVNGEPKDPDYKVQVGDQIDFQPNLSDSSLSDALVPESHLSLSVIWEDEDLLIINKPAGMVVHPAPGHTRGTIVNALLSYPSFSEPKGFPDPIRPGIVHRLDKNTSGLLILAKYPSVQHQLTKLFALRQVQKSYLAVIHRRLAVPTLRIEAPIGRDPKNRKRMKCLPDGKNAISYFFELSQGPHCSLILARIVTGRTHQIRVHLHDCCHTSVVGDKEYKTRSVKVNAPRQLLHAWRISFTHPRSLQTLEVTAPLPDDFREFLDQEGLIFPEDRADRISREPLP